MSEDTGWQYSAEHKQNYRQIWRGTTPLSPSIFLSITLLSYSNAITDDEWITLWETMDRKTISQYLKRTSPLDFTQSAFFTRDPEFFCLGRVRRQPHQLLGRESVDRKGVWC